MKSGVHVRKGVYYFPSRDSAVKWAKRNGWPIDRVIEYDFGWSVQYGCSSNYAGPDVKPEAWKGVGHEC